MSHFITPSCLVSPPEPILNPTTLNIIIPHAQVGCMLRRASNNSEWTKQQKQRQTLLLKKICGRLRDDEIEKNRMLNDEKMIEELHRLKAKMRKEVHIMSRGSKTLKNSVERIMKPKARDNRLDMAALNNQRPQNVDLFKKHRAKIVVQLQSYNQASEILNAKEEYAKWYNSAKNSPVNSPIFSKMTYLMERMHNKQSQENDKPARSQNNVLQDIYASEQNDSSFISSRGKQNRPDERDKVSKHLARKTADITDHTSKEKEGYARIKRSHVRTTDKLINL